MTSIPTSDPECVDEFFLYLLQACESGLALSHLPLRPPKINSIRFIDNDENNCREKYNGNCWKLVCIWNDDQCTNFAVSNKLLCTKHNARMEDQFFASNSSPFCSSLTNASDQKDEPIKSKDEVNRNKITSGDTKDTSKSNGAHFKQFSIDSDDEDDDVSYITTKYKSQLSSKSPPNPSNDIEYIGSKPSSTEPNARELISKNIPPLTSFEELYLGTLLMETYPKTCSILDAQLYLHEQAIKIIKKNYRIQMNTISSEYFYDFLLRQPRIAIHYKNWFSACKPIPTTAARSIDTKIWTLSMIVRGTSTSDD